MTAVLLLSNLMCILLSTLLPGTLQRLVFTGGYRSGHCGAVVNIPMGMTPVRSHGAAIHDLYQSFVRAQKGGGFVFPALVFFKSMLDIGQQSKPLDVRLFSRTGDYVYTEPQAALADFLGFHRVRAAAPSCHD